MVKAIDVHVHPSTKEYIEGPMAPYHKKTEEYFRRKISIQTPEELAEEYRKEGLFGVLLAWDAEVATGLPKVSNDFVARVVKAHPDVFIGFAGIDPWKGKMAIKELERAVKELGLRGVKMHPIAQEFFPNDHRFYPLWEKCQELEVPVLFHCGTTGMGAGMPGGGGLKLKYSQPMYLDDVAADFPNLPIILAHPSWPWPEESLAIALHKANVFIDLSGWSPKYFSPSLVNEINSRLQDKMLFGTDYPYIHPSRWLRDFQQLDLKEEVKQKVMIENARNLLKLKV